MRGGREADASIAVAVLGRICEGALVTSGRVAIVGAVLVGGVIVPPGIRSDVGGSSCCAGGDAGGLTRPAGPTGCDVDALVGAATLADRASCVRTAASTPSVSTSATSPAIPNR